jgi:hypothetical protein
MPSFERHNPNQWGYAGMTTAMKRSVYDDQDSHLSHVTKITKSSHFIPPAFQKRESIQSEEPPQSLIPPHPTLPIPQQQQQPGLLNDALISRLLNHSRPQPPYVSN